MAGKELSGIAAADAELFQGHTYALIAEGDAIATPTASEPRIAAFVKILEKIGAQPLWIGARQHDYAVGLASHLPQLAAVALASFLYDRLDENRIADHPRWARIARFAAAGGKSLLDLARHRAHQQRTAFRFARLVRAPPR